MQQNIQMCLISRKIVLETHKNKARRNKDEKSNSLFYLTASLTTRESPSTCVKDTVKIFKYKAIAE